jgi:hypothetical protein
MAAGVEENMEMIVNVSRKPEGWTPTQLVRENCGRVIHSSVRQRRLEADSILLTSNFYIENDPITVKRYEVVRTLKGCGLVFLLEEE